LKQHFEQTLQTVQNDLEINGINRRSLQILMDQFVSNLTDLPLGSACKKGCAYCCHLKVGASIPEVIVIYGFLESHSDSVQIQDCIKRILQPEIYEDHHNETHYSAKQSPCPFLNYNKGGECLIYIYRPFSCRAYHSLDVSSCKEGFNADEDVSIPCYPNFKAFTDVYSTIFTQAMKQNGLCSDHVIFVKALKILFKETNTVHKWLMGEDVFQSVRLT